MKTARFISALLLTAMWLSASAQQQLKVKHGCAYKSATEDATLYTFDPSDEARRIVSEICNAVGVGQNFDLRASSVDNALATAEGNRRIILYSEVFLKKFSEDARTRWAAYSVLAHEIGHHFNGHDFGEANAIKRKQMELEADRFSGSALRLLGTTLDEAKAGIETFALDAEQQYHPSARARREAVASGWTQQQERLEKMGVGATVNPSTGLPRERDTDADGIPDKDDACPEEYGRALTAGCPDADEDGVPDRDDACRYLKGPAQWKGCPDTDGDGLPNHEDQCPDKPGYAADKGCPPPDRDNDSVPDRADKCPDTYGQKVYQGCPDTDGDGVPDPDDKCPNEKGETVYEGCLHKAVSSTLVGENEATRVDSMIFIKGGTFQMGSENGESDETPVHSVILNDFYLGKYEVTFDEFDAYCTATGKEKPSDEGWGRGQRPVINIDWYDAVEYCNWRSRKENLAPVYSINKSIQDPYANWFDKKKWTVIPNWTASGYRLPTEAEWEYAARQGGKDVMFGNGKDIADPSEMNFNASLKYKKSYSITGEWPQKTVPVSEMAGAVNRLGLKHMSGNVAEWCYDWYSAEYYAHSTNEFAPHGPNGRSARILRGGGWSHIPDLCRATCRGSHGSDVRFNYTGFRLARTK